MQSSRERWDGSVGSGTLGFVTENPDRRPPLDADAQERLLAAVMGAHELAGTPLDAEAIDRVQRLTRGELTVADAYAELDAAYGPGRPDRHGGV